MGGVYRAEDAVLGRAVALKVLHAKPLGTATGRADAAKLLHEARAAAALNHPNAVAIFDVGEADGVAYIAMELLSGKTLRAYVRDESVPLAKRLAWLLDVASALEAAHKRGIVHRDVKPENVFVRSDGVIKVLDFGIAQRVSAPVDPTAATLGGDMTMTATGAATGAGDGAGTPLYMAPEQLKGEPVDGKTDQFGWAVVAYELLTGSLPWDMSLGALQLISQILSRTPDPPSAKRAEIPEGVDRVVLRALEKERGARFEDIGALIDALSAAIGGEPVATDGASSAAPPAAGTGKAATSAGSGKRRRAAAVGAMAALLVAGGIALVGRAHRAVTSVTSAASGSAAAEPGPPDYGSKMSTNAAAMTEYRAGMQAMIDALDSPARRAFQRAAEIDPGFAAAHLRRALLPFPNDDVAREHLEKALSLRADLGLHDRALLDAAAAAFRSPQDKAEIERTFAPLEAAPNADALYAACRLRLDLFKDETNADAAAKDCRGAWHVDGLHAAAHGFEGRALKSLGETEGARSAFAECVRISPSAVNCLDSLLDMATEDGRCADAAALARRLIAIEPQNAGWRFELVDPLFEIGEPRESYEEAMKQSFALMEDYRPIGEAQTRFMLAVLRGEFGEAEKHSQEWQRAVAHEGQELPDHWNAFYDTWLLGIEMGQVRTAGALAGRYQKERAAWDTAGDAAGGELAAVLYDSGKLTRAQFEAKRDATLPPSGPLEIDVWLAGFGHAVVTTEDARVAAAALERVGEVPRGLAAGIYYSVGDVLLRAGEPDKAIPFLTRATKSCVAMLYPFEQTRGFADLASALAQTGDAPGACAALRTVEARWGRAPASTTASAALRLSAKLDCPR